MQSILSVLFFAKLLIKMIDILFYFNLILVGFCICFAELGSGTLSPEGAVREAAVAVGRDAPLLVGAHKTSAAIGFGVVDEATDGMGYVF